MATPQNAIFRQGLRAHEHLEFDLRPGATAAALRQAFAKLQDCGIAQASVAGFSGQLWRMLAPPDAVPPGLRPLAPIHGSGGTLPVAPHDFWLWLQDRGPDLNIDAARQAVDALAPVLMTTIPPTASIPFTSRAPRRKSPPMWISAMSCI